MNQEEFKSYNVKSIEYGDWQLLSKSDSKPWEKAVELSDFMFPWEPEEAPRMVFKALHDPEWLYCHFEVTDKNIQIFVDKNHKDEVILGDRVEIFFRQNEKLESYYCLEIDLLGRVYDYHASFYRKFESQWTWPSGQLKVEAGKTENGYEVALAIGKESLKELGLLHNSQLQAGLFRGKCMAIDSENDTMRWISWVKPDSVTPDFHIPSSFGVFQLE